MKDGMSLDFGTVAACVVVSQGECSLVLSIPGDDEGCIEIMITDMAAWCLAAQLQVPINAEPLCEPTL